MSLAQCVAVEAWRCDPDYSDRFFIDVEYAATLTGWGQQPGFGGAEGGIILIRSGKPTDFELKSKYRIHDTGGIHQPKLRRAESRISSAAGSSRTPANERGPGKREIEDDLGLQLHMGAPVKIEIRNILIEGFLKMSARGKS